MVGRMSNSAIAASGLRKSYGGKTVLDGIDLDVPEGTVFALLGPNGAGKTTTVNILTTLVKADGGTARVAGHDTATEPKAVRAAIGVTGQFAAVDELLTGRENLQLIADLKHLPARDARQVITGLLDRFDLTGSAGKLVSAYSGGMRRKLDLAMTLAGSPRVIFLDEPTTGLDPRSRRTMWDLVRALAADGVTIFLTTQYLEEADQLASHIAVLDHGRIVAHGTPPPPQAAGPRQPRPAQLHQPPRTRGRRGDPARGNPRRGQPHPCGCPATAASSHCRPCSPASPTTPVNAAELSVHTPGLDDVFLALTGHPGTPAAHAAATKENAR